MNNKFKKEIKFIEDHVLSWVVRITLGILLSFFIIDYLNYL